MKTFNKDPEAELLLTPEQYRVTQQDGTERPFRTIKRQDRKADDEGDRGD